MGQKLLNLQTGERELLDDDQIDAAIASKKYAAPDAIAAHRNGDNTYASADQYAQEHGLTTAIDSAKVAAERGHKIREDAHSGVVAAVKANLGGAASGLTMGAINPFEEDQEFNRGFATVGQIGGALLPAFFGDEAGLANVLATEPLEAERAASTLSSKFLYSGELGAEGGTVARSAERGLAKAGGALDEVKAAAHMPADISKLDAAGLKTARESELAAIEAERVPKRAQLVEDLGAHASALKNDDKIFLATKGIKEAALPADAAKGALKIQEIGAISVEPDRQVLKLLRNPKLLAEEPKRALGPLMQQENALEQLAKRDGTLRAMFAGDTSGERIAALDRVPAALERNRALQSQIRELVSAPASERLKAIDGAKELLASSGKAKGGLAETMLGGSIMGHVAGMFSGMPVIGPMLGAKAGQFATDLVFGRLGKAAASAGVRGSEAVAKFLDVAKVAAKSPTVAVLATKTLARVAYAPRGAANDNEERSLPALYRARTKEIKSQTMYAPDGSTIMRPEARQAMASKLSAIRAVAPIAADRMETLAARRLEFLSSKIPRRPDIDGIPMGPDHWQPSEMEMRTFARYAAAVEDPHGVIERLAHGTITPEDAEAMRAVYPEMVADVQASITKGLPQLRKTLPYSRRVALSIFSGVPVDAAMKPEILAVLQGGFENEEGTDGGTQAPTANPQFGSIKKSAPEPTPSQARSQG